MDGRDSEPAPVSGPKMPYGVSPSSTDLKEVLHTGAEPRLRVQFHLWIRYFHTYTQKIKKKINKSILTTFGECYSKQGTTISLILKAHIIQNSLHSHAVS